MAKFYGAVGYAETEETSPGVWTEKISERMYSGDLIRDTRQLQTSDQVNDNVNISNQISILADPYAYRNFHAMRYIEFMEARWKIITVEVKYPRLILTIGGIYNGGSSIETA
ncbi:MAG: hypothetical protein Q4C65_02435 [Eubacteriales bacterium]|nr:hypothetical protein [Eubacteriales bacterium]